MATKTISIELDVYERLKSLKSRDSESFSQVLRRTLPANRSVRASNILAMLESGSLPKVGWTDQEMEQIESIDDAFMKDELL
ncbi:MAG: antitoxin VapB family protein [Fimbriimonas sp.]